MSKPTFFRARTLDSAKPMAILRESREELTPEIVAQMSTSALTMQPPVLVAAMDKEEERVGYISIATLFIDALSSHCRVELLHRPTHVCSAAFTLLGGSICCFFSANSTNSLVLEFLYKSIWALIIISLQNQHRRIRILTNSHDLNCIFDAILQIWRPNEISPNWWKAT